MRFNRWVQSNIPQLNINYKNYNESVRSEIEHIMDQLLVSTAIDEQHIGFSPDKTIIFNQHEKDFIYIPTGTGYEFHKDDHFVKLIMGPYGSGKTTTCLHEIVRKSCEMPFWSNGRRKMRVGIFRNTSGELYSTTLQSWLTWFGDLGEIKRRQKPLLTYEHTFNDGNGIIELELIFIALDREQDVRKIKSLELTMAYINELSEVPQGLLSHLKGRVNYRYPSKEFCSSTYWTGIIADTNPPDVDHWIYKTFSENSNPSYKLFQQPPGLIWHDKSSKWIANPVCDNFSHMAEDYYVKLAEGQTRDFVNVYCLGKWGSVAQGKIVFPEYNDDLHCIDHIKPMEDEPIYLGWDGGLTPACVVIQQSARGQIRILKEYQGESIGVRSFAENIVIPDLAISFPTNPIGDSWADPSCIKGNEVIEDLTFIGELCDLGIPTKPALTNKILERLAAQRYFLNMMIDGRPAFVICKKGCPGLRKGYIKDYYYKRVAIAGEERYKEEPYKNHASHRMDAVQYVLLHFARYSIVESRSPTNLMDMSNPVMNLGA